MPDTGSEAAVGAARKSMAAGPPSADGPNGEQDPDSLLDVFRSVETEESTVSLLSRELGDVSIADLLRQARQVASRFGGDKPS